ncbi:MAG TPA: hypothetical protein VGK29_04250 [Paludibaculum sp.]|jgi:hypothetical protein
MTNVTKIVTAAAVLGYFFVTTPMSAQNDDSCMSLTMLIQGKLQPPIGWRGPVKGLLVDKNNKVTPLEGKLAGPVFPDRTPPVYKGQVGHETFHFSFDFGTAGKFAGLLDHEIAQFSPIVTPHLDMTGAPPPFALGTTKSTFKVDPQTVGQWASSGWFEKATGNLSAAATFLVNSIPVPPFPDPNQPNAGPVIGYWNLEVTGRLCNLDVK